MARGLISSTPAFSAAVVPISRPESPWTRLPTPMSPASPSPSIFRVTAGAFQTTFGGERDGYIAKIAAAPVAPSAGGKVTGGGSVEVDGGLGTFAFSVQRKASGGPIDGKLQFIIHATRVAIRSVSLTSLVIASNVATISGTCTENGAPCTFAATVTDNGEPGTSDTFLISVSAGSPAGGLLRGGNVQVHD
jgi:hypothetical protein